MSLGHGASTVRSGLVLHLDAANPKSYSGSGTAWTDMSGNSNTGTLTNGPTYSSANAGSLVFDGINNYVATPTSGSILAFPDTTFTISVWIKTSMTGYSTTPGILIASKDYTFSGAGWGFGLGYPGYNGSTVYGFFASVKATGGYFVNYTSSTTAVNDGKWHNLVAVITTSTTIQANNINILYLDGNLISVNTFSNGSLYLAPTLAVDICRRSTGNYFAGNLSQISIYNSALSATEVRQNFEALRGRYGI